MKQLAKRGLARTLLLVLAFLATFLASPMVAKAGDPTCGQIGNYYDGFIKQLSQSYASYGVSANLTVRPEEICTSVKNVGNFAAAWTMIQARDGNGWAQSGFIRRYGYRTRHFAQAVECLQAGCSFDNEIHYQDLNGGEIHQYWTGYISSGCPYTSSCLMLKVDASTFILTVFNPNGKWPGPWRTVYSGETGYVGSDVPGRPTTKVNIANMKNQITPMTWESQRCGMDDLLRTKNPDFLGRWANATYGCNSRAIWTEIL